jgi:hypothetical protein
MNLQLADIDPGDMKRGLLEHYRCEGFDGAEELLKFIDSFWKLRVPRAQVCPEHTPPAEYIVDSFFEVVQDSVCWANRGGGKTLLGALATWLDTVFKTGCATKVLGGSLEQSKRMYEHLTGEGDGWGMVTEDFRYLLRGDMLAQRTVLGNLSNIQILTASSKSVRGAHPQKLKLDEIDEMDPRIYEAALSIPMSKRGHRASTHIYSTMHKTYGLMQSVVEEAPARGYQLYKWCILDVLERCDGRDCETCDLWDECQGRARHADGYYRIDDAISKKRQVSKQTWLSEYLCMMPSSEGLIYKEFDMALHVV